MTSSAPLNRRTLLNHSLLTAGAAAGTIAALTGCSAQQAALASAQKPSAVPSAGGTPVRVGRLADLAVGTTGGTKANGKDIVLFRRDEKSVLAYSAICTHAGCTVAAAGKKFDCPCHGSSFQAADGTVITGPAQRPLTPLHAAIDGDWITVSL
ncbi:ubiquinol-cytochrome c reductase iron-sulfur subunit [Arthrobacter sp. H14-L1]|uniref:QcrA and Rieske domain-containing protein n=1 Tax=Arthrobacter sp. H14-L1 TaxID=2996697 RepID=UPI0022718593|nr:Rieske (2Fe-2S) protein [Arthrobacter sp. H14-L1]MCY0904322.1 Rieske (2Fe-2S) protein [Arthrobacter sp. H14-L1]